MPVNIDKIVFHFRSSLGHYTATQNGPILPNQVKGWYWSNRQTGELQASGSDYFKTGSFTKYDTDWSYIYRIDVYPSGQKNPVETESIYDPYLLARQQKTGQYPVWDNNWDFLIKEDGTVVGLRQYNNSYSEVMYKNEELWPKYLTGFGM